MPIHAPDSAAPERAKYAAIWSGVPDYKNYSPGLENVDRFMAVLSPSPQSTLLDVGCGAGVAGLDFEKRGLRVWWLDITDAGLEPEVDRNRFIESPIWSSAWTRHRPMGFDFGFCCDVMEHIPPEYTLLCIDRILNACRTVWFQIALTPDEFGHRIGQPLHLTVQPYAWWLSRIASLGKVIDARDLCGTGLYVVSR